MRNFRDAETMAQDLHSALQVKGIETTYSECLKLIAKAFGEGSWTMLAAIIATAPSCPSRTPPLAPAEEHDAALQRKTRYCSFCGKSQYEVRVLVTGRPPSSPNDASICNECAGLCSEIVEERTRSGVRPVRPAGSDPA